MDIEFQARTGYQIIRVLKNRIQISGRISGSDQILDIRPDIQNIYWKLTKKVIFKDIKYLIKNPLFKKLITDIRYTTL